jgi:hypothetical protein
MRSVVLLASLLASAAADDDVNCSKMKVKELRVFLADRGLKCDGCAEKADFVAMCEANKDAPLKPKVEEAPKEEPKKKEDIEDILAGMKGMPGMEGIKMFTVNTAVPSHLACVRDVTPEADARANALLLGLQPLQAD